MYGRDTFEISYGVEGFVIQIVFSAEKIVGGISKPKLIESGFGSGFYIDSSDSKLNSCSSHEYVFFGGSLVAPLETQRLPGHFPALLDSLAGSSACVLVHRGLDCHIQGGPDCREEVGGAHFIGGVERLERPYYDHVYRREPVRLELWRRQGTLPDSAP